MHVFILSTSSNKLRLIVPVFLVCFKSDVWSYLVLTILCFKIYMKEMIAVSTSTSPCIQAFTPIDSLFYFFFSCPNFMIDPCLVCFQNVGGYFTRLDVWMINCAKEKEMISVHDVDLCVHASLLCYSVELTALFSYPTSPNFIIFSFFRTNFKDGTSEDSEAR